MKLLVKREYWTELRQAGRRYVVKERNWERSVANYQQVYGNLVPNTIRENDRGRQSAR